MFPRINYIAHVAGVECFADVADYFDVNNIAAVVNVADVYIVDALVREEVNTIDTSDLFLDVFVNDDFTNYGGGLLTLDHDDATSYPGEGLSVSVVQQPLPPRLMTKSRFTRWRL